MRVRAQARELPGQEGAQGLPPQDAKPRPVGEPLQGRGNGTVAPVPLPRRSAVPARGRGAPGEERVEPPLGKNDGW